VGSNQRLTWLLRIVTYDQLLKELQFSCIEVRFSDRGTQGSDSKAEP